MSVSSRQSGWVRILCACLPAGIGLAGCVIVTAPLAVDAGPDVSTTTGTTILLHANASGGSGRYRYIWSNVAGLSDPTAPNPTYLASTVGDHFLSVTVIDSSGDVASDTVRITVASSRQPLIAEAGPNLRTPVNTPVTLAGSASGGSGTYTFAWSPTTGLSDPNAAQPTFTPAQEGTSTFTLTVTDSEGVSATDTLEVTAFVGTTVTGLKWAANAIAGYQLIATFSQPVAAASAQGVGAYRVHDSGAAAGNALLGADNQTVTLTFTSQPLAAASTFDIGIAEPIIDTNGNAVIGVSGRPADPNPDDTTAPTVLSRQWGVDFSGSYQVAVTFSEAMDRASAQAVGGYRLNGSVAPTSAVLSGDGQTATLVFAGVALSPTATIDVGVGDALRDVNGLTLVQTTGQNIADNPADIHPPTIVQAVHAPGFSSPGYRVELLFNESMSRAAVENAAGYTINGVAAGSAVLGIDGRTVALTFLTPIASGDSLTAGIGGVVQDINGNALAEATVGIGQSGTDLSGPSIVSRVWAADAANYTLHVTFNESMDQATATTTSHYIISIAGGSANPTVASLDGTGKVVTLTFAATGAGLRRTETLTVSGSVRDINGRANTSTAAGSLIADSADLTGPSIAARVWAPNATAYEVLVSFNEVLDRTSAVAPTNYSIGADSPSSVALDTTGRIVTLTFSASTAGFNTADALTVSSNVLDVNGKTNTSVTAVAITAEPADVTPPAIASSVQVDATHVDVTFSEVMDKASVEAAAYSITNNVNVTAAELRSDGRTVRLTTDADPATETVTVPASVEDINGNAPAADLTTTLP